MTAPAPQRPLTADDCEQIFHACLSAGDIEGVGVALRAVAVRDPHRAQHLLDATRLALTIAQAGAQPTSEDTT